MVRQNYGIDRNFDNSKSIYWFTQKLNTFKPLKMVSMAYLFEVEWAKCQWSFTFVATKQKSSIKSKNEQFDLITRSTKNEEGGIDLNRFSYPYPYGQINSAQQANSTSFSRNGIGNRKMRLACFCMIPDAADKIVLVLFGLSK